MIRAPDKQNPLIRTVSRAAKLRCVGMMLLLGLATAAHSDALRVGMADLDYPPFYFHDGDRLTGAAYDIAEWLADYTGHQLSYEAMPFVRVQKHLQRGELDMVMVYFRTPEREQHVAYLDQPHLVESSYLVVSAAARTLPDRFDGDFRALTDYRFLSVRGYFHGSHYEQALYLLKEDVNNEQEIIRRVLASPRFIGVGNRAAIEFHAARSGVLQRLRFIEPAIDRGANYIAFSRRNPDHPRYVREFSEALKVLKASRDYRAILKKYAIR